MTDRHPFRSRRRVPVVAGVVVALLAFSATLASASLLPLGAPAGVVQNVGVDLTVTNRVRDLFASGSSVNLTGVPTDFNGGSGIVSDGGPLWAGYTNGAASSDWVNSSSNYVTRNAGGTTNAAAVVDWLTRRTTVQLRIRTLSTSTDAGVLVGSNATGSAGLVARLFHTGSNYAAQFWLVTGGDSWSACGTAVNTGTTAGNRYDITVTYAPGTGAAATANFNKSGGGGGSFNISSTCSLATANGARAGLYSGAASTTRYDNFDANL